MILSKISPAMIWWDVFMGKKIRATSLDQLQTEAFIVSVVIAILLLLLSFLVASAIARQSGSNARDHIQRRWWFGGLGVIGVLLFFVTNTWKIAANLSPGLQQKFNTTSLLSILVCAIVYFVGGFILAKILPNSNFGTIFSGKKNSNNT